jgi:hypothetical protein
MTSSSIPEGPPRPVKPVVLLTIHLRPLTTRNKTTLKQTQKKQRFSLRHISDSIIGVGIKETRIASVLAGNDSYVANMKKTRLRKIKLSEGRNKNDGT